MKSKEKVVPATVGEKPNDKEKRKERINDTGLVRSEKDFRLLDNPALQIQSNTSIRTKECRVERLIPMKQNSSKYVGLRRQPQIG